MNASTLEQVRRARPLGGTRFFYLACSITAGLGLIVIGLREADVLSIGPRPGEAALSDFFVALALGVVLGVCFMAYLAHLYRRQRDFFVEFRAAQLHERLRWRFQRWILLSTLPVLIGGEILMIVALSRELEPLPIWLGIMLCIPLVARPWAEVDVLARERRATRGAGEGSSRVSSTRWDPELTRGQYLRQIALWIALAASVAIAGYTLMLPRREEHDQAKEFVRALVHNGLAGQETFYKATDASRKGARTCDPASVAAAEPLAREVLRVAPDFTYDWNYGNALHYGNLVLGRLALSRGDSREASRYLLRAGLTPGSPQLNDYGPDMTLARELLKRGESPAVLRYLSLCNRFWKNTDRNCIEAWRTDVRGGRIPDFGSRAGPMPMPEKGWTCELIEKADVVAR